MSSLGFLAGASWEPSMPHPFYLSHATQVPSISLSLCHSSFCLCVCLSHSLKTKKWVNEVR